MSSFRSAMPLGREEVVGARSADGRGANGPVVLAA
ncbi:hypothetical protein RKD05_000611 [Microbacterium sp. SLBN-111]